MADQKEIRMGNEKQAIATSKRANKISIIAIIFDVVLAIFAGIIAWKAYQLELQSSQLQLQVSRLENIVQPLTYTYDISSDVVRKQNFENADIPTRVCKMTFHTGFPMRISIINSDDTIENMYSYYSPIVTEPLNDSEVTFDLPFTSSMIYDRVEYQYIFIYTEGVDSSWHLDCVYTRQDLDTNDCASTVFSELDLLRLSYESDPAMVKILQEYQNVYTSIVELKSQN